MPDYAPGIPEKGKITDLPDRGDIGEEWTGNIQLHEAEKAGRHHDLRLSPPGSTIAYSWAVPKGLPDIGKKHLAVRTEDHSKEYLGFSGEIKEGYGKGKVKSEYLGPAQVQKVQQDKIYFTLHQSAQPQRYMLMRLNGNQWLLYNFTPTEDKEEYNALPTYKKSYKKRSEDSLDPNKEDEVWAPKLDGAHNIVYLRGGKMPDVFSYRSSKKGDQKIDHTFKTSLWKKRAPRELDDTVLRGELWTPGSTSREVSRILNSSTPKANEIQAKEGKPLKLTVFDLVRYKGRDVEDLPYAQKLDLLTKVQKAFPDLELPPLAIDPKEKQKLYDSIKQKSNVDTLEGIVVYDKKDSRPHKVKILEDWEGKIKDYFEASKGSKYEGNAVGGLIAEMEDGAQVRIGTGIDDETRKDIYKNFENYKDLWARFEAQTRFPSGQFRMPVLKDIRAEKYPNKE